MDIIEIRNIKKAELLKILNISYEIELKKKDYFSLLQNQTLALHFNTPSTRTQISFHASITELGGSSYFIDPKTMHNEDVSDFIKVLSCYCCAYGIRLPNPGDIIDTKEGKIIWKYGDSAKYFNEIDKVKDHLPIVSLRHDDGHPCQGLCELKTYKEALGLNSYDELKGKNLLITWTNGKKVKPWSPTLETLKIASKFGMNITLCNPEEFSLDRNIVEKCKKEAKENGGELIETENFESSFRNQDIVYGRNWVSSEFIKTFSTGSSLFEDFDAEKLKCIHENETDKLKKLNIKYKDRTVTMANMQNTNRAKFINPMPFETDIEAKKDVWERRSLQNELLKNKLHIQKAVLAFVTGSIY